MTRAEPEVILEKDITPEVTGISIWRRVHASIEEEKTAFARLRGTPRAGYKYGITGFLYYETCLWASNTHVKPRFHFEIPHEDPKVLAALAEGRRWPDIPWNTHTFYQCNGDGQIIYHGWEPHSYALKAKLTKDRCFHRLGPQMVTPKDLSSLGRKEQFAVRNFSKYDLVEWFWRYEDLTGQDIMFARPNPGSTLAELNASVAYVKCVPLTDEDIVALKKLKSTEETKILMGTIDGGGTFG